jgi:hypothetical protein
MGDNQQPIKNSRRSFLSLLFAGDREKLLDEASGKDSEKVKMLTADGKLVEVDKRVFDEAQKRVKATNKEIYNWMNNPSKEK